MSGQLSDFLAAHTQRITDVWVKEAGPTASSVPGRAPQQFMNAILVALTADDLGPLLTFYELEGKVGDVPDNLDVALRHFDALTRATMVVAVEEGVNGAARLDLLSGTAEDLAMVARRLSVRSVGMLAVQLASASTSSSARGTSLSITMHELRRPLTILNSYGQLLSAGMLGVLPETASVAIEGIQSSTEMMIRLVNALFELSRLEDPDDHLVLEELGLGDIVAGALETIATEAKFRECTIEKDVEESVRFHGDRRRLMLALTNILSNALKHSPSGGVVEIRAYGDDEHAHFIVTDRGPGFPADDAVHLFDKYYRSAAERQRKIPGSGLGLYIVKTVAERHLGRVVARSPGEGAEFEIIIPLGAKK